MDPLAQVVSAMTQEVCDHLRRALETGRWPDGRRLTAGQLEHCMQLVIAWETDNLPEEERCGYMEDVCRNAERPAEPDPGSLIARDGAGEPS